MSVIHRALHPSEAVLAAWVTIEDVRVWSQVSEEDWAAIATALGDPGLNNIILVGGMPPHLLTTAIEAWVTTTNASPLSRLKMAMLLNGARLKLGMDLVDVLPSPAPVPTQGPLTGRELPTAAAGTASAPGVVKIKLSQVVDQSSDQEVPMLPIGELTTMRMRFTTAFGDPPLQRMEVTDSQLTALHFKVSSGQAPYADFGVWGPHGARIERRLKFVSYALTPAGAWRTLELPGADCLDTWRDCWAVFKTAAVMLDIARPSTLDLYAASFEERCRRYPRAWHLCAQADIRCRSEFLIEEKRRQEAFH